MNIKAFGASGRISLGKAYAGRTVVVGNPEEGVWIVRTARVIPDPELRLDEEPDKSRVEVAREEDTVRFLPLHPDHDSACRRRGKR